MLHTSTKVMPSALAAALIRIIRLTGFISFSLRHRDGDDRRGNGARGLVSIPLERHDLLPVSWRRVWKETATALFLLRYERNTLHHLLPGVELRARDDADGRV